MPKNSITIWKLSFEIRKVFTWNSNFEELCISTEAYLRFLNVPKNPAFRDIIMLFLTFQ